MGGSRILALLPIFLFSQLLRVPQSAAHPDHHHRVSTNGIVTYSIALDSTVDTTAFSLEVTENIEGILNSTTRRLLHASPADSHLVQRNLACNGTSVFNFFVESSNLTPQKIEATLLAAGQAQIFGTFSANVCSYEFYGVSTYIRSGPVPPRRCLFNCFQNYWQKRIICAQNYLRPIPKIDCVMDAKFERRECRCRALKLACLWE